MMVLGYALVAFFATAAAAAAVLPAAAAATLPTPAAFLPAAATAAAAATAKAAEAVEAVPVLPVTLYGRPVNNLAGVVVNETQIDATLQSALGISLAQIRAGDLPAKMHFTFDGTSGLEGTVSWDPRASNMFQAMSAHGVEGWIANTNAALDNGGVNPHVDCDSCFNRSLRWLWFMPIFYLIIAECMTLSCKKN